MVRIGERSNCRAEIADVVRLKHKSVAEPTMSALMQTSTRQLTNAMVLVSQVAKDGQVVVVRHRVE
jgi:hypothetical protein